MGSNWLSISSAVPCPDLKVYNQTLKSLFPFSFALDLANQVVSWRGRKETGEKGARAKAPKVEAGRLSKTGRVVTLPAVVSRSH